MPKTRTQKEQSVADLTDKFKKMKGAVLVDYKGLKVKDAQKIREKSWAEAVDYEVIKKSLLKLALKNAGLESTVDPKKLEGNIGLVTGYSDEVTTAKFAATTAKEFEAFKILGGLFEGKFVDTNQIKALASLPSRVELLAKLVGTVKAPISGFVNVLAGNLRGLVQVLNAIKESKS
ncbi:50S ribosomal protein L10 [Candidatus Uhrbacteria bacterium RIFCSPLOWO2_01_FULL_47_24]|uniref:Large ribosomal subunit protein uL10 n=1 Tax=Candidatus Uhrbacteria bacterium RIFCSPLOWO2_01_FULL_47_24 TaxID=1802401 RepID=A0A1F7UPB6_9BACT|nr:MAG: 50S ribosomal protein L10 [Candidatus Uhrbacteria bacterium RIFCSPHIGHO2_01_FULL_47_11]OGL67899.1 MAG: 50S ribosomal protein L10 [Candidatus Uhrbacteria bacterium RIFCSPHIGHO2_02_FULL_46_47]OGL75328.1 MAG: 50S ribosomal protein L10 [Candidatus Uhrbacteria bacterium RIFCSPHIGHO2_12_FULL_47_11]OGL80085.1 MAG: 50S ribosomal protein L10 [Candidatus Uhrbacteria bacterium RIFCSPLOWO2_01_FULL_47_24]OGL84871.1 MAG: 50S ribosomal protein L10 [Candidatus Uhrbacteria bacterium RIFCSPLOWO2_02_FULL_